MAKRRRAKTRTVYKTRTVIARPSYTRRKRSGSNSNDMTKTILGAMVYGGVRQKASDLLAPVTAKVPLGSIADEVVLGAIHYFGAKKVSNPMLKSIFHAGLIVESARVGEAVADGSIMNRTVSKSSSSVF